MNVQISEELFGKICTYILLGDDSEDLEREISDGLKQKLEAMIRRELYSRSVSKSVDDAEREKARIAYLDRIGMQPDFRW